MVALARCLLRRLTVSRHQIEKAMLHTTSSTSEHTIVDPTFAQQSRIVPAKRKTPSGCGLLAPEAIKRLQRQGCAADDWSRIHVSCETDLARIRNVHFGGDIRLGRFRGEKILPGGLRFRAGIYDAVLYNCTVGDDALIRNVHQGISDYDIDHDVVICDVSSMTVNGETSFGNGQLVHVLREDETISVPIYDRLSSNIAFLLAALRHQPDVKARIKRLIDQYVASVTAGRGRIGAHATVLNCGVLANVRIGPSAQVCGALKLTNCSLNSTSASPVVIGEGVILCDSIVSSSTTVNGAAIVTNSFLGQGVKVGRQFSMQDTLVFANSEFYHGEARSSLAGPFTVSHHKSALLIATQTSFFNAGSGSSQSNHAYKAGPVHQGLLERGCRVRSSSHLVWPSRVGAFTTVAGRHKSGFDTTDFPFSHLVEIGGRSRLIPGINLTRIGIWRDVRKWKSRDRRAGADRLDLVHIEAFSPYTVAKMMRARNLLDNLRKTIPAHQAYADFAGVSIKREHVVRGKKIYSKALERYLAERIVEKLESIPPQTDLVEALSNATFRRSPRELDWCDIGGFYTPADGMQQLATKLASNGFNDVQELQSAMRELWQRFESDSWEWLFNAWLDGIGKTPDELTENDLVVVVRTWKANASLFCRAALEDCLRDLATSAMWDRDLDVFGESPALPNTPSNEAHDHPVVSSLNRELREIDTRAEALLRVLDRNGSGSQDK